MTKLRSYLDKLSIVDAVTKEELDDTITLLNLYAPLVRQSLRRMDEYTAECFEARRQSVTDFINLAIDYDHDSDRKRIADRLAMTGHSMQLLDLLEEALMLVRDDPRHDQIYYKILNARYFDCYCKSNEDAFLHIGISSATYYRHIKEAQKFFAAMLWHIVIPDCILASQTHKSDIASAKQAENRVRDN